MFFKRLCFISLMTLPACSVSGTEQLTKQLQPAASWLAAVDFAAESWVNNRVPTSYVQQMIQEASRNVSKTRQSLEKIHDSPADTRSAASALLGRSASTLRELRGAVSISDLRLTRARADHLKSLGDSLDAMVDKLEAIK